MSPKRKPYMPGILGYIAREVGEDVAQSLALARGGRAINIPSVPKHESALSKIVGLKAAQEISILLGAGTVNVPCGDFAGAGGRRARIAQLWAAGLTQSQIAAEVDVALRTVERVVAAEKDQNQLGFRF
jgi:DNA-binding NarL/FixJ family response regulator